MDDGEEDQFYTRPTRALLVPPRASQQVGTLSSLAFTLTILQYVAESTRALPNGFRKGELGSVKHKWLHESWPADIDTCGMVRGISFPLGNAANV